MEASYFSSGTSFFLCLLCVYYATLNLYELWCTVKSSLILHLKFYIYNIPVKSEVNLITVDVIAGKVVSKSYLLQVVL